MAKIPIGLQLYAVRGACQKDLAGTLKKVAEIGYVGAEPWGYRGDTLDWLGHNCKAIRKMYDDQKLTCCGLHMMTEALQGDNLKRSIEFNKTLGNNFLIIACDAARMKTTAGIMELAKILNDTVDQLKPLGMACGYHAHGFDFAIVDGKIAWDVLFSNTRSEVIMQMDIGNCASGGGDPIGTLRKFPNRARTVHLKDFGGPDGSVIGEGKADWPEVFRLCEKTQGTEWYVVEECDKDGLGYIAPTRALKNLKSMGK